MTVFFFGCKNSDEVSSEESNVNEHATLQHTKTNLPLEQFVKWVADKENKLVRDKIISDINYQLAYLPCEYMAYTELKNENFTEEKFEEVKRNYEGMTYFKFRMEVNNGSGEVLKYNLSSGQQYNERINYMSFKMQKDIFLVQGRDTLLPGLFHYERIFELAPYATVMMAFDNEKFNPADEFTIVYNDHLFNKGYIKFNYKPKQLIDLPKITGV